jgi:flagellar biosynthesis protein FlhG
MPTIISVASGKGGVGKSVVVSNLGLLLASRGKRVVLADLDIGGSDLNILFGIFNPPHTLTDFVYRKIDSLEPAILSFDPCPGLYIIPGTGDTLATANMPYERKRRLIHHLKRIDTDIIIVDVGAGTNFHALDFFLMSKRQFVVATPDPTSVLDLYRFTKLAAIRRVLSVFLSQSETAQTLANHNFNSLTEVLHVIKKTSEEDRLLARQVLQGFHPHLILNRVSEKWKVNTVRLKTLLSKYLGGNLITLGEIPEDEAVIHSIRAFLPVADHAPASPAAVSLSKIADKIMASLTPKAVHHTEHKRRPARKSRSIHPSLSA